MDKQKIVNIILYELEDLKWNNVSWRLVEDILDVANYWSLAEAAEDFINKVETGRARSINSYNKFKNALKY